MQDLRTLGMYIKDVHNYAIAKQYLIVDILQDGSLKFWHGTDDFKEALRMLSKRRINQNAKLVNRFYMGRF